ncbi:hypothetical protein GCM10011379_28140 [Filimonas zeae]|uniref:histidine kinase n=2 Tax=Filimonas zeae TaxID=1737353 RepID=A0A917IY48_9BACT|nr:hypothetical protein GCM10011379_28140 [Filimonas zeae]
MPDANDIPLTQKLEIMELFIVSYTHEVRSFFTAIHGALYYIEKGIEKDRWLNLTKQSTKDALSLIENMLTTVKLKEGKLAITLLSESFHFTNWLFPFITTLRENPFFSKDIHVDSAATLEKLHITTDKIKLEQIVLNLVANAQKYSARESYINILCYTVDDYIIIKVTNKGTTIPPEKLKLLFTLYYQADAERAGVGLGLYLSKLYVDAMGGSIDVNSKDMLTVFTVKIPLQPII